MKKILPFLMSLFIGIALFSWIIGFVGWQEIKSAFLIFTGWQGAVIVVLSFLMLSASSLRWKMILKSLGHNIPHRQLVAPYLTSFAFNYLFQMLVVGGEVFRIYILKEKHSVPWKKAVVSVIADKLLDATSFIITILFGVIFFLWKIKLPPRDLGLIIGGFLLFITIGLIFFYFRSFRKQSIARPLIKLLKIRNLPNGDILDIEKQTFKFFDFRNSAFWSGVAFSFLRIAVSWLRAWLLLMFLGKSIALLPGLSILGFYYIAMMIPIPADLGAHEAIQVFAFSALGLGIGAAPAFAMIQRGAELIMAFIGIIFFFKSGLWLVQGILLKKLDALFNNKDNQS